MTELLNFNAARITGEYTAAEPSAMPDGGQAIKIISQAGAVITYTGESGSIAGAQFTGEKILVIPVYFESGNALSFRMSFRDDLQTADGTSADIVMRALPGFPVNLTFPLAQLNMSSRILPRSPGRLDGIASGTPSRAEHMKVFALHIPAFAKGQAVFIGNPYLSSTMPRQNLPERPLVDVVGQWKDKEWRGKTSNRDELIANYSRWFDEAAPQPPPMRSRFGGSITINLGGTGFFRTGVHGGRHYFIDPDGFVFFSLGVACVRPNVSCPVDGFETLFDELPPKDGQYAAAWHRFNHDFDFGVSNLISAFGGKWRESWTKLTVKRLRGWGFNTLGNWSDSGVGRANGIPYVIQPPFPSTKEKIFRDFPDVFSPEYEENAAKCAESLIPHKDEPLFLGYFMRHEPDFLAGDYDLTRIMLASGSLSCCKQEFILEMRCRYADNILALNKHWESGFNGFEDLEQPFVFPDSDGFNECIRNFNRKLLNEYIKIPASAYRSADINHLNLGMRRVYNKRSDLLEGSEYFDVFSLNCYEAYPDKDEIERISEQIGGKPVLISEFSVGSLDSGLLSHGRCGVTNQDERGFFYNRFTETAAHIPEIVGVHYFQYADQHVLGRFDGEGNNVGLVDVCGRPYSNMTDKAARTNSKIYAIHSGKALPTSIEAAILPQADV